MKNTIRAFFYYTRSERNGALTLIGLLTLLVVVPTFFPAWISSPAMDPHHFENLLKTWVDSLPPNRSYVQLKDSLFPFDPNTLLKEEFELLGLKPWTIRTIINYRDKGGVFRYKKDLQKIYNLPDSSFQRLYSFISLPERQHLDKRKKDQPKPILKSTNQKIDTLISHKIDSPTIRTFKSAFPNIIDINQASMEDWQQLRGIGPGYSKRIVNFREKLGGFCTIRQVAETYGLPDSTYQKILPFLNLKTPHSTISVNEASKEELGSHPYISWKQAEIVINFRNNHGPFQNLESFQKVQVFSIVQLKKLQPYLHF